MTKMTILKELKKMEKKNDKSLRAYVFGTLRHARLQAGRQRSTHFGLANAGRRVQTEFLTDIAGRDITESMFPCRVEQLRRRQIVTNQIREFTSESKQIELIERRLFLGECIATVADELCLNQASARSLIKRVKQFLGLPPK